MTLQCRKETAQLNKVVVKMGDLHEAVHRMATSCTDAKQRQDVGVPNICHCCS